MEQLNRYHLAAKFIPAGVVQQTEAASFCHQSRTSPSGKQQAYHFKKFVMGYRTLIEGF
jgi:hypothetical protein